MNDYSSKRGIGQLQEEYDENFGKREERSKRKEDSNYEVQLFKNDGVQSQRSQFQEKKKESRRKKGKQREIKQNKESSPVVALFPLNLSNFNSLGNNSCP